MSQFSLTGFLFIQDAIANFTTEQEIASAIKEKFEQQYPSVYAFLLFYFSLFLCLYVVGGIVS